jgi:hypothetical protein
LLFLFAVLFIAGHCGPAQAKEVSAEFDQANKLYEEGKYSEAAALYESAVKAGQVSPALCFNLGNALFKAGQPGRALVGIAVPKPFSTRSRYPGQPSVRPQNVAGGVNCELARAFAK